MYRGKNILLYLILLVLVSSLVVGYPYVQLGSSTSSDYPFVQLENETAANETDPHWHHDRPNYLNFTRSYSGENVTLTFLT